MRTWYIIYKDRDGVIQSLTDEQAWQLFKKVSAYQNGVDLSYPWSVDISFLFFKNEFERNEKKYQEFIEKQSENWKKWGRPMVQSQEKPKKPKPLSENPTKPTQSQKSLTVTDTVTDKETDIKEISKDITPKGGKRNDIDELLENLRKTATAIWAVYDNNKDRYFGKHILSAKEFWEFAEKVNKSRAEAAIAVMKVSASSGYWKWVCAWPMLIYQNYADVYNRYQMWKTKQESKQRVAVLPWVW